MADSFQRHIAKYANDVRRCLGALVGISQGLVCDGHLNDKEIHFLNEWLIANDEICVGWPGDIIHQRIKSVLADGVITEAERAYLVDTLQELIGGTAETVTAPNHVTQLAFEPGFSQSSQHHDGTEPHSVDASNILIVRLDRYEVGVIGGLLTRPREKPQAVLVLAENFYGSSVFLDKPVFEH